MASQAYKNNGAIVIWFDETEGGDTDRFTLPEIVISPLAKGNAYSSNPITRTPPTCARCRTYSEFFGDRAYLGGAATANDAERSVLARSVSRPAFLRLRTWAMMLAGFAGLAAAGYRRKAGVAARAALG